MERILVFCLIVWSSLLGAQPAGKLDTAALKKHIEKNLKLLDPNGKVHVHYAFTKAGVQINTSVAHVSNGWAPEYTVNWDEIELFRMLIRNFPRTEAMRIMLEKGSKPFTPEVRIKISSFDMVYDMSNDASRPLTGRTIVIDPGHIANDLALGKTEQKFIEINPGDSTQKIELVEGQLTWHTAILLKARLEKAGATVFLTRSGPGMTAFGKTFAQWKEQDFKRTLDSLVKVKGKNEPGLKLVLGGKTDDRSVFRYVFRDAELRKRSELINVWKPDYTVIIHFNVDETNVDWKKTSDKNFCMAFVPGGFSTGDLGDAERRFDFLRLMLTNELDQSLALSANTTAQFEEKLDVPLAKKTDATYLANDCVFTGNPGVYSRNIALTRLVQGPFVYGETLYQDNRKESYRLMQKNWRDPYCDLMTSERLGQVADAYYQGILKTATGK